MTPHDVPHPDADKWRLPRSMRWQRLSMFESVPVPRWWAKPFARWLTPAADDHPCGSAR